MALLLQNSLYLLALINPVSKVFILSMLPGDTEPREVTRISVRSSLIALAILISLAAAGKLILTYIFHVDLYSLRIAGGLVLLLIGINALTKGVFFETSERQQLADISIVPLASPLIAGPATITAAITFSAEYGFPETCLAIFLAVTANLLIMLGSRCIGGYLTSHQVMGPLIRITGLVVATIAVQLMLSGMAAWWRGVR